MSYEGVCVMRGGPKSYLKKCEKKNRKKHLSLAKEILSLRDSLKVNASFRVLIVFEKILRPLLRLSIVFGAMAKVGSQ